MTGFYNITTKIKETLEQEPFVNTITYGNIDDVDLNKQNIFPLLPPKMEYRPHNNYCILLFYCQQVLKYFLN